jgi:hypothetical protein
MLGSNFCYKNLIIGDQLGLGQSIHILITTIQAIKLQQVIAKLFRGQGSFNIGEAICLRQLLKNC